MKKHNLLLTILLTVFFVTVSFGGFYAHAESVTKSLSGDEICGASSSTRCTFNDAKNIASNAILTVIKIGSIFLVLFILYRFVAAWFALQAGNTNAYKDALKKVTQAIFAFFIISAVVGGFVAVILNFLGLEDWTMSFVKLLSDAFVPHVYAAEGQYLPNPLKVNSLYDFLLLIVRVAIRWFVYPALIVMWVWSGFSFVEAQGNPEKLMKARNWLMWAVVSTIVVFMAEGFLYAIRGTVNQILPKTTGYIDIVDYPIV